jgi:hypothetical protein
MNLPFESQRRVWAIPRYRGIFRRLFHREPVNIGGQGDLWKEVEPTARIGNSGREGRLGSGGIGFQIAGGGGMAREE